MTRNLSLTKDQVHNLNLVTAFLAKRDLKELTSEELNSQYEIREADLIIVLGNSIPYISEVAAKAFKNGISKELMLVGGIGHSTSYLIENIRNHEKYHDIDVIGRAEANILRDVMIRCAGINENQILY